MRYLILINIDEPAVASASDAERKETTELYRKYTQELQKAGVMLGGDALLPSGKGGARIKVNGGKRSVTDGPFSEAKEVIGGYYLIQVKSHEEAVEWGSRCPGAARSGVEIRQVLEM
jgi:hypothetical protein